MTKIQQRREKGDKANDINSELSLFYTNLRLKSFHLSAVRLEEYSEYSSTSCLTHLEDFVEGDPVFEDPDIYNGKNTIYYYMMIFEGPYEYTNAYPKTFRLCGACYLSKLVLGNLIPSEIYF